MGLSPLSLSIYLLLCHYTEDHHPTLVNIANDLGVHRNSACNGLKALCDAGVIRKTKQGQVTRVKGGQGVQTGYQSEYCFTDPDKWVIPKPESRIPKPKTRLTNSQSTNSLTPNPETKPVIIKE